jgi:hypothetical protein
MHNDFDRLNLALKRWVDYQALFTQLISNLPRGIIYDNKWPKHFTKALDSFISVFNGQVVYTYHEVSHDKIMMRFGGPSNYIDRRRGPDEVIKSEGYIGKTLQSTHELFQIFPEVREDNGYLRANDSTKSELVIKIYDSTQSTVIAVLNLESTVEDDFIFLDGLVFALIAAWHENVRIEDVCEDTKVAIIKKFSEVFQAVGEIPKDDSVVSTYGELLQYVLPYNAMSLATRVLKPTESKGIKVAYCKGYSDPHKYKNECSSNGLTFPYHVLLSGELQEELIELYDNYGIKNYRALTEYALGACFPRRERSCSYPSTDGAVIVEFNKRPTHIDAKEILQEMAELYGHVRQTSEQLTEWSNLAKVVSSLPKFDLITTDELTATEFLAHMAEALFSTLCAERCIIFEICSEAQKSSLKTVASFPRYGKNSNVLWSAIINQIYIETIQQHLKGRTDYEGLLPKNISGLDNNYSYGVFATKLQASLNGREFLFVSITNINESDNTYSTLPKATRSILSFQLQSISTVLEKKRLEKSINTLKNSIKTAIQLLFKEIISTNNGTIDELEEAIFDRVHSLLEQWNSIIKTPYAAIYKYDKKNEQLIMTKSTVKHIEKQFNFLKRNSSQKPLEPLLFDVNPKSQLADKGLTYSVFRGPSKSLVSVNVIEQGSRQCIKWWDNAVGASATGRYFAGARIIDPKRSEAYGVLTINGNKPPDFIDRELEAEWEVLPLLEVLSDELARHLGKIYEK